MSPEETRPFVHNEPLRGLASGIPTPIAEPEQQPPKSEPPQTNTGKGQSNSFLQFFSFS